MEKEYIGDGVYVAPGYFDGQICLTTENGWKTTNTIYLDPSVFKALLAYWKRAQ